jgi:hypothetical protein
MGESMPRNVNSSHMKQAFATRQKTSQKRAKLRRMKELYASHLGAGGSASAPGGFDSDGNKSASEDELLQVRPPSKRCNALHGNRMVYVSDGGGGGGWSCAFEPSRHACWQWSSKLSFDDYHSAWEAVASTAHDAPHNSLGSATNSPHAFTTTPMPV